LFLIENLKLKEKVVADKKVRDGVNVEKDGSFRLDDCSIDIGTD